MEDKMRKTGFTLAEVLITIGIVGVVAAMTIPNLQTAYKARKLRSQFNKSLSTLQQVVLKMQDDGYSLDVADNRNGTIYGIFKKYLHVAVDCGTRNAEKSAEGCYKIDSGGYKTLGRHYSFYDRYLDDGQLILQDGTSLLFESFNYLVLISVDLNGYSNPPNIFGYDIFTFQMLDGKVLPVGALGTTYSETVYCNKSADNYLNGIACAKEAQSNSDYFKWVVKNVK
jgi:prepilin-type N-terminal cleavage/methylation domain-containing protein